MTKSNLFRTEDHMVKVRDKLDPEIVILKHSVDAAELVQADRDRYERVTADVPSVRDILREMSTADLLALAEGAGIRTLNEPRSYLIDRLTSKVERREVVLP